MSATRLACDLMYSAASREFEENNSLQRERWRSVPVSARRDQLGVPRGDLAGCISVEEVQDGAEDDAHRLGGVEDGS